MTKQRHEIRDSIFTRIITIFLFLIIFLLFSHPSLAALENKFLIIHLDGVSSQDFLQELEAGNLPNLERIFGKKGMIPYGLTLYPGATEVVIPRMKDSLGSEEGPLSWGAYDRQENRIISPLEVFLEKFFHVDRRARANYLHGFPGLDFLAGLSMYNIPELLDKYPVLEFYWFGTDTMGHIFGRKQHHESLRRFDRYLGELVQMLEDENINIIIYTDHGMTFKEDSQMVPLDRVVEETVEDNLIAFFYPNIYLEDVTKKGTLARRLNENEYIDLVFYKKNPDEVVGLHQEGRVFFIRSEEGTKYSYEGKDVFKYFADGYCGGFLTDEEWLSLTYKSRYPAVPCNVYNFFTNPLAGDLAIVVEPPKIPPGIYARTANHTSLLHTDMMGPILLKGPDVEHLYEREYMWLHTLFQEIPELCFQDTAPQREKHSLFFWGSPEDAGVELGFSPSYRWRMLLEGNQKLLRGQIQYDLFSSFISRLWISGGLEKKPGNLNLLAGLEWELTLNRIIVSCRGTVSREGLDTSISLGIHSDSHLAIKWRSPGAIGMGIRW